MFIYDRPIASGNEDLLSRKKFSETLGKSIASWKEKESLVVALYGEWGSGKSSVINLSKEYIEGLEESERPTVIEFNPWLFSDLPNLTQHFFTELAKELELNSNSIKDQELADKLRIYSSLLHLKPIKTERNVELSKIMLGLGLTSVAVPQILQWLQLSMGWGNNVLFFGGIALILFEMFKEKLPKVADASDTKVKLEDNTIHKLKKDIQNELARRDKRLLIIIDDIDRLSQLEIRQIFRLIRVNADFPKTIYLLSFDRKIVEKSLEEQCGISGKDYLEKIVQVSFDIPLAKQNNIAKYLTEQIDQTISKLPKSAMRFFDENDPYWTNMYNSGFKNFFKNIRDVKRFISSLDFNISQMFIGEVMEVNPVDFIAIEAIRIFAPELYEFMKSRKEMFTSTYNDAKRGEDNPRKIEFDAVLNSIDPSYREQVLELIKRLFPQIEGLYRYGYYYHDYSWQSSWSKALRVCATNNFDCYFTLIPGGDEEEISHFEIEDILNKAYNSSNLEELLREYIEKDKISKVLSRLQDYTDDTNKIPAKVVPIIVQALFNISDEVLNKRIYLRGYGTDMEIMNVINQLLKRERDKNINYSIIEDAIVNSSSLYGPIQKINIEYSIIKKGKNPEDISIPEEKIGELQKLCVDKIKSYDDQNKLLLHTKLVTILYIWKDWDIDSQWKSFVQKNLKDDESMIILIEKFISESHSKSMGDYGYRTVKRINYKNLQDFTDIEVIRQRLEKLKENNLELYKEKKYIVDNFLTNFGKNIDFE